MFPLHGLLSRPIKVLCVWTRIGAYVLRLSAASGLDLDALETGRSLSTACAILEGRGRGRDESVRRGAGSQWIVAARPLCHLQCPVAYLSRLQRIQPAARGEGSFEAVYRGSSAGRT